MSLESKVERMKDKYEKVVIAGDYHIPFEDKQACRAFDKFLKDFKPDTLIINGDFLDFYDLSKFDKDYRKENKLQEELDKGYDMLANYRKMLPNAKIFMTTSNHMEKRLERFKRGEGKALASLEYLTTQNMLKLDELNIKLVSTYDNKHFMVLHGDMARKHSGYTAKGTLDDKGKTVFMNHVHRLASHYKTDELGTRVGVECGCMCTVKPEYIDGVPNWQQGFAVIYRKHKGNWFQHYLVKITNGKFIFNGKEYDGRK